MNEKPPRPSEDAAEAAIVELAARPGAPRTITPEDVARALSTSPDWQSLLPLVRRAAIRLAESGRVVIYRKGKPVDPSEFRGVYRLGLPPTEGAAGAGNSSPVRPAK